MFWTVFWMLMCGHALADFPLQTPDMAKGKNYTIDPAHNAVPWYYWLASHCFVHGLSVTLLTGSVYLGFAEFLLHGVLDWAKCAKLTTIHFDQLAHTACKALWAMVLTSFAGQL